MNDTQPFTATTTIRNRIESSRSDVEEWKKQHNALHQSLWLCEDLVQFANFIFGRILSLDSAIQMDVLSGKSTFDKELDDAIESLIRDWMTTFSPLLDSTKRVAQDYGNVDGAEAFRKNFREAEGILTPDEDFFVGDKLVALRDQALAEHRAGQTESLFEDE